MRQVQAAKVESFVFKKNKIWHKCKILTFFWVFTVYFYCWHTSQESIEAAGRLHARSLANWSSDTEIVLSTPACIWELSCYTAPMAAPRWFSEQPLATYYWAPRKLLSSEYSKTSVLFKHKYWIWFYFMFHSVLQFISENPTLYGLVIEQRPIFGPQGASWNIFRLFPHYSLKIWQEKRWR